jgi:hypothetical protein
MCAAAELKERSLGPAYQRTVTTDPMSRARRNAIKPQCIAVS